MSGPPEKTNNLEMTDAGNRVDKEQVSEIWSSTATPANVVKEIPAPDGNSDMEVDAQDGTAATLDQSTNTGEQDLGNDEQHLFENPALRALDRETAWTFFLSNPQPEDSDNSRPDSMRPADETLDEQQVEQPSAETRVDEGDSNSEPEENHKDEDQQAIRDAIAEDVAAQAAAADAAAFEEFLDEQDRWINDLANNNPDEFARLVASGVIDEDIQPQTPSAQDEGNATASPDDQDDAETPDEDNAAAAGAPPAQPVNPVWIANPADAGEENDACPACLTKINTTQAPVYLTCGHAWCQECLNDNYRHALKSRRDWPPQCCEVIDHDFIIDVLEPDVTAELFEKLEEFDDDEPTFCQTPKCTGGYIRTVYHSGQWAACQTCHKSTCRECKALAAAHPIPAMHPSMQDLLAKADKKLADGQGWKQCPGCRNLVERIDGCKHMSCECGDAFCYECGKTLHNGMPCNCGGEEPWVQEINAEQAATAQREADEEEDSDVDNASDDSLETL